MKSIVKYIYKNIPFKQQIFSLVKKIIKPPHSIYRHLYFNGIISFRVNNKEIKMHQKGYDVENTLFWSGIEGCWEKVSVDLWIKLCKDASVILDVGANTGAYSLIAKTINNNARVIAFEPLDFILKKLEANIRLNKLEIEYIPVALSNYDGKGKVFMESEEHIYSVTVNKNLSKDEIPVTEKEIVTKKLSTIIKELNLTRIDIMKIDVETHEPEMLTGMEDYLREWKPVMLIEILTDEVANKVEKIIGGMGYLFFNINENGGIRKVSKLEKSDYYNYLLCSAEKAAFLKLVD